MAVTAVLLAAKGAFATCDTDADCKGGKVCVQNRCAAPVMQTAQPMAKPVDDEALEVSFYLGGGSATLSPSAGNAPSMSSGTPVIGLDFAGKLSPLFGVGGGLYVQYGNFDQVNAPNINDVNIKGYLGPRLEIGRFRATLGLAGIFTILATSKKTFASGTSYTATHFGVGLLARADVLLTRHVGLFGTLGLDGSVYDEGAGTGASQLDFAGGILLAF
jgi:hypothetical protein